MCTCFHKITNKFFTKKHLFSKNAYILPYTNNKAFFKNHHIHPIFQRFCIPFFKKKKKKRKVMPLPPFSFKKYMHMSKHPFSKVQISIVFNNVCAYIRTYINTCTM